MRTTKTVVIETTEKMVEKVACNMCGKVAKHVDCTDINDIEIQFGYGSKFDLETWSFDLCDECCEKVINNFKIPPQIHGDTWDGIS